MGAIPCCAERAEGEKSPQGTDSSNKVQRPLKSKKSIQKCSPLHKKRQLLKAGAFATDKEKDSALRKSLEFT